MESALRRPPGGHSTIRENPAWPIPVPRHQSLRLRVTYSRISLEAVDRSLERLGGMNRDLQTTDYRLQTTDSCLTLEGLIRLDEASRRNAAVDKWLWAGIGAARRVVVPTVQ